MQNSRAGWHLSQSALFNFNSRCKKMAFNLGSVTDFIGDVAENASEFPEWLRSQADEVEKQQIDFGQDLDKSLEESQQKVQENLKSSKYAGTGAKVGRWLSKPVNMLIAVAGFVGLVYMLSTFQKT